MPALAPATVFPRVGFYIGILDFESFGLVGNNIINGGAAHFFKTVLGQEQRDAMMEAEDFIPFFCGVFEIH